MLQRFPNTQIIVEIPDVNVQGIVLKQKAHVQSVNIELAALRVALNLLIKYYGQTDEGDYADELNLPGITAFNKSLVADMTTLVDAETGVVICNSVDEYIDDENNPGEKNLNPSLADKTYMYEFELFAAMMYQPTVISSLCIQKIQYAFSPDPQALAKAQNFNLKSPSNEKVINR